VVFVFVCDLEFELFFQSGAYYLIVQKNLRQLSFFKLGYCFPYIVILPGTVL
jgi:hypothetical protein